jgi:signal transduction histidine kinase
MTVDGDRLTVEAALDRRGTPAPLGIQLPITNLQVAGKPVVPEAIRAGRPVATAAYDTGPLAADHAASVEGVRHYITWPLLLGGEVDAVLFLARRRDVGFSGRDVDLLAEFATIAALLLRNARLLRSAEAASVAKSNFLNLAAHELRTPVAVIRGYLNLLAEGDVGRLSTRQREVLGIVSGKTEELSRQVEQLLLASRVGAAAVRREPVGVFDIVATCREALTRAQPRADALGATLALEATDAVFAHGSPTSVGIVLDNLVNNALTYSRPPARVTLAVGDGDDASITVEDAGIGIAPGDRAHVFDQFHRIDRPDFGYPSGTGLGLYIARELVEADGGTLELEWSEVDVGSRFRLRLPAAGPPADAKRKPKLRERVRATSP